jgi:hypothetical protein
MTKAQNFIFHEGGLYCVESFDKLSIEERQLDTWSIAEVLDCLIDGISNIVVEWDNLNASSDLETPPCLRNELVSLSRHDFAQILWSKQREIATAFNEQGLDGLQGEFRELVYMYQRNETIKTALDTCTSETSFVGGWGILATQFQNLKRLCSQIDSVFPGTSTVESDFSVNGWEKMNMKLHSLIFHWEVFSNANSMKCILQYRTKLMILLN